MAAFSARHIQICCSTKLAFNFYRNYKNLAKPMRGFPYVWPEPAREELINRYKRVMLKPLEELGSIEEKLQEILMKEPKLEVNISLPSVKPIKSRSVKDRLVWRRELRSNKEIEAQARDNTLKVDLEQVYLDWQTTDGPFQIQRAAEHYGVYHHMFQHAYFTPLIPLNVGYEIDDDTINPVYFGNILPSSKVEKQPFVSFESKPDELWTLVLTNLDGNLLETESEYLHWFIGNIKGGDLSTGETLCHYLQPFPWKGTGYHRLVFTLYRQEKAIDFSSLQKPSPCHCLKERTFKMFDFYKEHQDHLTPAGLAFFQCTWDTNLTPFIHNVLEMREPVFEYNAPKLVAPPQIAFPENKAFNEYLDRYRDPKDIKKEVLLKRLRTIHPFEEEPPMPKYPMLHRPDNYMYSWQKDDIDKERMRQGKYKDLNPYSVYQQEEY